MCALRINEIKITTEKAEIILELKVIMNQIGTKILSRFLKILIRYFCSFLICPLTLRN